MTEIDELKRDLQLQHMANNELRAKIKQLEGVIRQLRQTMAKAGIDIIESELQDSTKPKPMAKRGRPTMIDDATRARVKVLSESGLSYREIAKKEAIGIGTISKIIRKHN